MYNTFKKLAAGCTLFAVALLAHAGPVITNGGFETGDFTGWTLGGDTASSLVIPDEPNNGAFSAVFLAGPSDITQTLATEAGHTYAVKFWLRNLGSGDSNITVNLFEMLVDNASLFSLDDKTATLYTEYTVQFTAASDSTDLSFNFLHHDTFWLFDDVSISEVPRDTQVPEPGTLLLLSTVLGLCGLMRKRR